MLKHAVTEDVVECAGRKGIAEDVTLKEDDIFELAIVLDGRVDGRGIVESHQPRGRLTEDRVSVPRRSPPLEPFRPAKSAADHPISAKRRIESFVPLTASS